MRAIREMRVWFCLKWSTIGPVMSKGFTLRDKGELDEGEGGGLGSWGTRGTGGTTMSASALSKVVRSKVKPSGGDANGSDGEPEREGAVQEEVVEEIEDCRPRVQERAGCCCVVSADC